MGSYERQSKSGALSPALVCTVVEGRILCVGNSFTNYRLTVAKVRHPWKGCEQHR